MPYVTGIVNQKINLQRVLISTGSIGTGIGRKIWVGYSINQEKYYEETGKIFRDHETLSTGF